MNRFWESLRETVRGRLNKAQPALGICLLVGLIIVGFINSSPGAIDFWGIICLYVLVFGFWLLMQKSKRR